MLLSDVFRQIRHRADRVPTLADRFFSGELSGLSGHGKFPTNTGGRNSGNARATFWFSTRRSFTTEGEQCTLRHLTTTSNYYTTASLSNIQTKEDRLPRT